MGTSNSPCFPIKVFCFGNQKDILQKIFTTKIETNNSKYEQRILKKSESFQENESKKNITIQIEWRAILYPDLTEDNINDLFEDLGKQLEIPKDDEIEINNYNDSKFREKSKNIIIKFGKNCLGYLIRFMDDLPKTYLPQIAIVTKEDLDGEEEVLRDNRYLSIIRNNSEKTLKKYLWEKECYYNERGAVFLDVFNDKIETNNYINIMLTGLSRTGKSTLINVLSQKLVTLESPFLESVTNYIREYKVLSENGIFQTGIRFFDTPGLAVIKNQARNTMDEVKSVINRKMKECQDARDDIHLIYFMLKGLPNLENYSEFFRYFINLNEQRVKNGKKKIYIIFIFNGSSAGIENSFIEYLKDNKLEKLIEIIKEDDKENKDGKVDYKKKYSKKNKAPDKKIKNNIVRLNLIKDDNSNVYGIDVLLKVTLYFLKKDNQFEDVFFKQLEDYKMQLENKNKPIDEQKRNTIERQVNLIFKELANRNSFLGSIRSIEDIREKANRECQIDLFKYILAGYINLLYPDNDYGFKVEHIAFEYLKLFKTVAYNYKIFTDEIILVPQLEEGKNVIKDFQVEYYSKNDNKENCINYEKYNISNMKIDPEDITINGESIYKDLSLKSLLIGIIADNYSSYIHFTDKIKQYFEKYLKDTCCIKYILRQKELYLNIFKGLEEKAQKKDWDVFKEEIFD